MKTDEVNTLEAAKILGCSPRTILRMIERGGLHARKLDPTAKSVFRIDRKEVEQIRTGVQPRTTKRTPKTTH